MLKKMLILATAAFFVAPFILSAEMAPQFNKSANDQTDLSKAAPKHERLLKNGDAMESTAAVQGGDVMENNAADLPGDVMENNAADMPGDVMENNAVKKPGDVMENNAATGKLNQNQSVME